MSIAIGLMSGTSMDGIDAALIETDGQSHVQEMGHLSTSYTPYVRHLLKAAEAFVRQRSDTSHNPETPDFERTFQDFLQNALGLSEKESWDHMGEVKNHFGLQTLTLPDVIRLSTELHKEAVHQLLETHHLQPHQVDVIGYHGQTLYHNPAQRMSVQIGDGQYLSSSTRIKVVNNFRIKDIQAGGQGAPFAPLYHQALAVRDGKLPLAVVNCGGISNITIIRDAEPTSLVSYDPGPGNSLEELRKTAVRQNNANYLAVLPPKSLDIGDLRLIPALDGLSAEDGCTTLEVFTADTIVRSLDFVAPPYPKYWILAGGGWYNPVIKHALIELVRQRVGEDVIIEMADEAGWNNRALEAQIFAYLAVRHLNNLPTSYPATTGVSVPTVGGDLFFPVGL